MRLLCFFLHLKHSSNHFSCCCALHQSQLICRKHGGLSVTANLTGVSDGLLSFSLSLFLFHSHTCTLLLSLSSLRTVNNTRGLYWYMDTRNLETSTFVLSGLRNQRYSWHINDITAKNMKVIGGINKSINNKFRRNTYPAVTSIVI